MSLLQDIPIEVLVIAPLAIAAGIDLYLTLLFLGAAPTTPWWDALQLGVLGDLDSLGILAMAGGFYVLEFLAERDPASALVWNAFHSVIRPVAGALLALLLLDGQSTTVVVSGAFVAGVLASASHAIRSGTAILQWLGAGPAPHAILVSFLEDAVVLALLALAADLPFWALAAALVLALTQVRGGRSRVRAFTFAVRLFTERVFRALGPGRWTEPEDFPSWTRGAFEGDVMAPGGGLRGAPVAALRLPDAPLFVTGWVVVRGDSPIFVYRRGRRAVRVGLGRVDAIGVVESGFFRRLDLAPRSGQAASIYFGLGGPSPGSLRAEFLFE